jgi:hypothetical protein
VIELRGAAHVVKRRAGWERLEAPGVEQPFRLLRQRQRQKTDQDATCGLRLGLESINPISNPNLTL